MLDFVAEATGSGRSPPAAADDLWMTWGMAREMQAGGMSFGGHTVSHPVLSRLGAERQEEEIAGCKDRLEAELGRPMEVFSYPVGLPDCFDATTRACLERHDVAHAFSCYGGFTRPGHADRYDVPRVTVGVGTTPRMLRATTALPQLFGRS